MFPLQRGNELVIKFSSSPHQQQHKIPEDLILDEMITSSQPREQFFRAEMSKDHHKSKKIMVHREIERKRRQDMASFYASLRSLLPLEFIKGKRSLSEHINEAANYIKHMQNNLKELGAKRDELKKLSHNFMLENHESNNTTNNFTVHENNGILGIEITSDFKEESLKLSKLLHLLHEEGHDVVNWFSTELDGRLVYSVQCKVNNSNSLDLSELKRKVANAIPTFICSD
ncbi:transcription factor bHLH118-like isoform X2 [Lotus japonicus]|uniref:transcription factor bHLH118-like isoform X2 n=1 Tax=Lotus japonicus TaxID=34305 RepID=UPI002589F252|nr:transcription factor bHLH118-like isoform X2 [Lotus japonicus]